MEEVKGVEYNDLKMGGTLTKNVSVVAGVSFEIGQVLSEKDGLVKPISGNEEGAYIARENVDSSSEVQVISVYESGMFNADQLQGYDSKYESSLRKNNILVRGGLK